MCLTADTCVTADPGVASLILARSHTFAEIGHEKISTAISSRPLIQEGFLSVTSQSWGLSGRVLDSRPKGRGFEPHRRHCVVVLEQDTFILA